MRRVGRFWSSAGNAAGPSGLTRGISQVCSDVGPDEMRSRGSLLCTDGLTVCVWFTAWPLNIWILKSGPSEQRAALKEMEEITAVSGSLILHSVMEMSRQEAVMFWRWSVTETHFNILCCLLCLFVYLQGSTLTTLWSFVSHFLFEYENSSQGNVKSGCVCTKSHKYHSALPAAKRQKVDNNAFTSVCVCTWILLPF